MREVESEDGSLAALALGVSKLNTWQKLKRRVLESNATFKGFSVARDLSPNGKRCQQVSFGDSCRSLRFFIRGAGSS